MELYICKLYEPQFDAFSVDFRIVNYCVRCKVYNYTSNYHDIEKTKNVANKEKNWDDLVLVFTKFLYSQDGRFDPQRTNQEDQARRLVF